MFAVCLAFWLQVLDVLLSRGAHVNMTMGGLTLLHISASKNNLAIMELLLKKGARVDFKVVFS